MLFEFVHHFFVAASLLCHSIPGTVFLSRRLYPGLMVWAVVVLQLMGFIEDMKKRHIPLALWSEFVCRCMAYDFITCFVRSLCL